MLSGIRLTKEIVIDTFVAVSPEPGIFAHSIMSLRHAFMSAASVTFIIVSSGDELL